MQQAIADMQDYRQALAARYAELETMGYRLRLELERVPHWKGQIQYLVRIVRLYEDGGIVEELMESYVGKDRRKALSRFEELIKQRPGIEAVKDIERRQWER